MPVIAPPPEPCNRMVLLVMVNGSMSSLKVTITLALVATLLAPAAGTLLVTVGGVTSGVAPVVNVHTALLAKVLFAKSLAPVVIVAVNTVLAGKVMGVIGVKVAVFAPTP